MTIDKKKLVGETKTEIKRLQMKQEELETKQALTSLNVLKLREKIDKEKQLKCHATKRKIFWENKSIKMEREINEENKTIAQNNRFMYL